MVLYGTDFVRWISQECRSFCRRLLYLHEYIGLDHHGVFWDERRCKYPALFTNDTEVAELVKDLTPLLALCVVINNVQPVLSGVAIGAGWQAAVAYVNIACYYLFGIPVGLILGYKVDLGVKGIWCGMMSGTILQTCVLLLMVYKTNWNKEASLAEDRIRSWGGGQQVTQTNIVET
ncbi:hypothetical protein TSUD_238420 [Trifolium subterraneum]|uniref:Protein DETOXIFICATION n=1 Tax=Trifolium subterraneum TaxID=3900 RepID=A0A2Z6P8Y7_TRISU|nr:hypothetical protein TSUD_238420 [Trifolium subterraneum]